jgi:chaperonin cofactor prefoldin
MWDSSTTESDRPQRRSLLRFLPGVTIGLLGAGLAGCLYWHPVLTFSGFSLISHQTPASLTATSDPNAALDSAATASMTETISRSLTSDQQTGAATPSGDVTAAQLDAMIGQLQSMQRNLQGVAQELDQRYPASRPTAAAMDVPAMLAEIERLNQIMQPLMKQLEAAIQSERSESEIAAMRVQMDEIHRRLEELLSAVQAARGGNGNP